MYVKIEYPLKTNLYSVKYTFRLYEGKKYFSFFPSKMKMSVAFKTSEAMTWTYKYFCPLKSVYSALQILTWQRLEVLIASRF